MPEGRKLPPLFWPQIHRDHGVGLAYRERREHGRQDTLERLIVAGVDARFSLDASRWAGTLGNSVAI